MKIASSMSALKEITQLRLPYAKARDIYKIYKLFESEHSFFAQEEVKLVQEFAEKDADGNPCVSEDGIIKFKDAATKMQYVAKFSELGEQESDIEIKPVALSEDEIGNQIISPETMSRLEDIISFE
jgi:hypothetical protein